MPKSRALLVMIVLALAIASIVVLALVPTPVTPKPFMTYRGLGYLVIITMYRCLITQ
ncbi:hypothetical protein [Vulcanisaeta sp. EB80]|uniref:hypothetical protein n=1 Tax=Vulcanisaeta sp. EB80 TaxID=1650660 RepID=UPI00138A07BA|nr:hypothetical protein [Vulcanisaeta sp. EB80]